MNLKQIIEEVREMYPYKEAGNPDSYSRYNEGWEDAVDTLEQRLEENKEQTQGEIIRDGFIICISGCILLFLIFAFVVSEINPFEWEWIIRFVLVIIAGFWASFVIMAMNESIKDKDKSKKNN